MCSRHRDFVLTLRMRMLSEPRVCVCSCIVRCAQQRDGKMHRETMVGFLFASWNELAMEQVTACLNFVLRCSKFACP